MTYVSVIIPNYNHSKYLVQRISSVLNQTYPNFEVIILDDCSTDNSREIIERYRIHPKVVQIMYNQVNSGSTFKQWERGIEMARGEWIWIAESDDWCEPSFLETLIDGVRGNQNISLAYAQSYYMLGNNRIKWISQQRQLEAVMIGTEFIPNRMLLGNGIFNASMALFRKEIYRQISPEYTRYSFCGDWIFWGELASKGAVFISGKVLNYFRNHEGDVSGKAYQSGLYWTESLAVLDHFYKMRFIDKGELVKGYRCKYQEYRKNRKGLLPEVQAQLDKLFRAHEYFGKDRYMLLWDEYKQCVGQKIIDVLRRDL